MEKNEAQEAQKADVQQRDHQNQGGQSENHQNVPKKDDSAKAQNSNLQRGTVKFFNTSKGFGFIKQESGKELFFHVSETKGVEPRDGDSVEFEVGQGRKGPCAMKVRILN